MIDRSSNRCYVFVILSKGGRDSRHCVSSTDTDERICDGLGGWKNETHADLCLLQEVAAIQGGVRLFVHPSCQVQAPPGVIATENLVTDEDAPPLYTSGG